MRSRFPTLAIILTCVFVGGMSLALWGCGSEPTATVYSGALDGGADDRIDTIYVFLPDAAVTIAVWAPVDPLVILDALAPVE